MSLTSAAAASQILSTTFTILNAARERAQASRDVDLKSLISKLYDNVNGLNEAVRRVTEENEELKRQLATASKPESKPMLREAGLVNHYYFGDDSPYCQACYDKEKKLTKLSPAQDWSFGVRRHCVACNKYVWEKPYET